jgi:Tol biopolymer transport system component
VPLSSLWLALSSEGMAMLSIRRAHLERGGLLCAGLCLLSVMPACTLTADAFSPELLLTASQDAGVFVAPDATSAAATAEEPPSCTSEGAEGAITRGASCAGAIGLLAPAEVDAGTGAVPALEPLSLPACSGELGGFGEPEPITGLDFEGNVFGPALSPDGRTLFFSAYIDGEQQLYSALRTERGADFSEVTELDTVSSGGMDGSPFLAESGARLYFFSDRQAGVGNRDIWFSDVGPSGTLAEPALVGGVNTASSELLPWLSPDERTMLFVSSRPGGRGGADIWRATRSRADSEFGAPSNVFELSSNENEGRLVLSRDGRTAFFTSDRGGGLGGPDIYTASRPNLGSPFSSLRNLNELNSTANDLDVMLSSDDTELLFASSRRGRTELWLSERRCNELN